MRPLPDTTQAAPQAATPRWRWRWRLWAGAALLVISLPLASLWALLHHSAALPWLLQQVPGLSVEGLQGTLAQRRIQAHSIRWQLPADGGVLTVDGLLAEGSGMRWAPYPGAWFGLRLTLLSADSVQYLSGPAQRASAPPDLLLPLGLQVDS